MKAENTIAYRAIIIADTAFWWSNKRESAINIIGYVIYSIRYIIYNIGIKIQRSLNMKNKKLSIFLSAMIGLSCTLSAFPAIADGNKLYGDLDNDGMYSNGVLTVHLHEIHLSDLQECRSVSKDENLTFSLWLLL